MARAPRFLAPEAYRQRRLRDAAHLLPLAGAALLLVPLLWGEGDASGSAAVLYVFAVWAGLVAGAAWLGRRLDLADAPQPDGPPSDASQPEEEP